MITRCYFEITNVCNLNCVFCPKTERAKHTLTLDEFDALTLRLEGEVKFLYFHLMGEPFLHPLLPQFVLMARRKGFVPVITTNGTLLSRRPDLLDALPHKIQISLHSHEGNAKENLAGYVDEVMARGWTQQPERGDSRPDCATPAASLDGTSRRMATCRKPLCRERQYVRMARSSERHLRRAGGVLLRLAQSDWRARRRYRCAVLSRP